jgi:hypothetical protein
MVDLPLRLTDVLMRVSAAEALLSRGWGRPIQPTVQAPGGNKTFEQWLDETRWSSPRSPSTKRSPKRMLSSHRLKTGRGDLIPLLADL